MSLPRLLASRVGRRVDLPEHAVEQRPGPAPNLLLVGVVEVVSAIIGHFAGGYRFCSFDPVLRRWCDDALTQRGTSVVLRVACRLGLEHLFGPWLWEPVPRFSRTGLMRFSSSVGLTPRVRGI